MEKQIQIVVTSHEGGLTNEYGPFYNDKEAEEFLKKLVDAISTRYSIQYRSINNRWYELDSNYDFPGIPIKLSVHRLIQKFPEIYN